MPYQAFTFGNRVTSDPLIDAATGRTQPMLQPDFSTTVPYTANDRPSLDWYKQFDQPQTGVLGDSTTRSYNGGSSTGGSAGAAQPAYDPNELAYLDQQKSLYQRLLGDTDTFEQQGLTKLGDSYNQETNKANLSRGRALEDFGVKRQDTQRAKQEAVGRVDTNARTLSNSLRRILGMASGTGSSAYQVAAPGAVARQASQQRNNVMTNYGANFRDLDTAENRATIDFDNYLAELAQQKKEREGELRGGFDSQRQGINQSLAQIEADRAGLLGGNQLQAAAPYRTAYNTIQDRIVNYGNQYRTAVDPREVQVQTPNLRDYVVDRQSINANKSAGQSQYSPYSQFLRPRDEEELAVR